MLWNEGVIMILNKKAWALLLGIFFVFSLPTGYSSAHTPRQPAGQSAVVEQMNFTMNFGEPNIVSGQNGYVRLVVPGTDSVLSTRPGDPILPSKTKVLELNRYDTVDTVTVHPSELKRLHLNGDLEPTGLPHIPVKGYTNPPLFKRSVYESTTMFPAAWFKWSQGVGLNNNLTIVKYLPITLYPVRYIGATDTVVYTTSFKVTVTVKHAANPNPVPRSRTTYDMVIITSSSFKSAADSYAAWRTQMDMNTKVVTLDDITGGTYTAAQGRDTQEKMKYFIKWALDNWGITYVLLMGDADVIPVRYADIPDGFDDDGSEYGVDGRLVPADLYYADIYDAQNNFCSWDSNNNNVFGEWGYDSQGGSAVDHCDLYPDVLIGRIPASTTTELNAVISKLENYYSNIANGWWDNIVLCGTDTFDSSQGDNSGVAEGEYSCNYISQNYVPNLTPVKCYSSNGKANPTDIAAAINSGGRFVHMSDHGTYDGWGHDSAVSTDSPLFSTYDAAGLSNSGKYPFFTIDACLCGGFDNEDPNNPYSNSDSLAEVLLNKANAGAIGVIAASRVGMGGTGTSILTQYSGYYVSLIYYCYSQGSTETGQMWSAAKVNYINNRGVNDYGDFKTLVEYTLFGDPSFDINVLGISLTASDTTYHVVPGDTVNVPLNLKNNGQSTAHVTLSSSPSDSSWSSSLSTSTMSVASESSSSDTVTVSVPSDCLAGDEVEVTVAAHDSTSGLNANLKLKFIVDVNVDLTLSVSDMVEINPGDSATFNVNVDYNGDCDDTLTLTLNKPSSSWDTQVNGANAITGQSSVLAYQDCSFLVGVTCPADELAGTHILGLRVTSEADGSFVKTLDVPITVDAVHALTLKVKDDVHPHILPGGETYIDLKLDNTGNIQENLSLAWDLSDGPSSDWTVSFENQFPQVAAQHDSTVKAHIIPPEMITAGDYTIVFSASDADVSETVSVPITIDAVYKLNSSLNSTKVTCLPGTAASLTLELSNEGNDWDTVNVMVDAPDGWSTSLKSSYDLEAYSRSNISFSVNVPDDMTFGEYTIKLGLSSTEDSGVVNNLRVTVEVPQVHDLRAKLNGSLTQASVSVRVGGSSEVPLSLDNRGNGPESVSVDVQNTSGSFKVTVIETTGTEHEDSLQAYALDQGKAVDLSVRLETIGMVEAGDYVLPVVVTYGEYSDVLNLTESVLPLYDCEVLYVEYSDNSVKDITLEGGKTAVITIGLKNTGNTPTTFNVEIDGSGGSWCSTPEDNIINPGETGELTFDITAPDKDASGEITITPTAQGHPLTDAKGAPYTINIHTTKKPVLSDLSDGIGGPLGGAMGLDTKSGSDSGNSIGRIVGYAVLGILFIVFLILLVAVIITVTRKGKKDSPPPQAPNTPPPQAASVDHPAAPPVPQHPPIAEPPKQPSVEPVQLPQAGLPPVPPISVAEQTNPEVGEDKGDEAPDDISNPMSQASGDSPETDISDDDLFADL